MNAATLELPTIHVYAGKDSPRLRYVLDWLLGERLGLNYRLTHDKKEAESAQHCIAYGFIEGAASIHATGLLWETGTRPQAVQTAEWEGLHTLFFDEASPCDIQFDLLAGIFYLLTRYEEYLSFTPDRHNRYPAQQSILFPALERPVVDEWVEAFRQFLEQVWSISIPQKAFSFQPSYDIDIAWSYRFKGFRRTLGAVFKDIAGGRLSRVAERMRVLRGAAKDPFESFVWMLGQHMDDDIRPLYFILAAAKSSPFDKNIAPTHPRMASLIKALDGSGRLGLHPSYYSDVAPEKLTAEQRTLERITGHPVHNSRQHFIKLRLPQTYHTLIAAGITDDWSMGYSTHFGFRAGTSHTFLWYDLEREGATNLRVHPFSFMDSTAHYDLGLSAEEAFARLRAITDSLSSCGGFLVTIMHNYSLGTDAAWTGWATAYKRFLNDVRGLS